MNGVKMRGLQGKGKGSFNIQLLSLPLNFKHVIGWDEDCTQKK